MILYVKTGSEFNQKWYIHWQKMIGFWYQYYLTWMKQLRHCLKRIVVCLRCLIIFDKSSQHTNSDLTGVTCLALNTCITLSTLFWVGAVRLHSIALNWTYTLTLCSFLLSPKVSTVKPTQLTWLSFVLDRLAVDTLTARSQSYPFAS